MLLERSFGLRLGRVGRETKVRLPFLARLMELSAVRRIVPRVNSNSRVRLLVPGCTESPTCQCGEEMDVATIEMLPEGSDAAVRVYRCNRCHREMRLTVWATLT